MAPGGTREGRYFARLLRDHETNLARVREVMSEAAGPAGPAELADPVDGEGSDLD